MAAIQSYIPVIAHSTATLVGLVATVAGVRSILAPRPFAETFGFPQSQTTDPFIPVVGVRNIATGLAVLVFSSQRNIQAMGVVLVCNLAAMIGDSIITYKNGTKGSANHHIVASVITGMLGSYLMLS